MKPFEKYVPDTDVLTQRVFTKENGSKIRKMDMANKFGQMEQFMRDNGRITYLMAMVSILNPMEILLREVGEKERLMEMPLTCRNPRMEKLEIFIEEIGNMAKSMAKVSRTGLMEQSLKVSTWSIRSMVRVLCFLQMGRDTQASSKKESLKEQALTIGQMENATKANGKIARCKVLESFHGQMELSMLDNSAMTNFKDRVNINSMMARSMSEVGMKESNMVKENSFLEIKLR
jgi:hypothetical protein